MTTINEIKDRLDAVAFAGRSYAGTDAEALEVRLLVGDPVDKLVNVAQGAAISPKEAGE